VKKKPFILAGVMVAVLALALVVGSAVARPSPADVPETLGYLAPGDGIGEAMGAYGIIAWTVRDAGGSIKAHNFIHNTTTDDAVSEAIERLFATAGRGGDR